MRLLFYPPLFVNCFHFRLLLFVSFVSPFCRDRVPYKRHKINGSREPFVHNIINIITKAIANCNYMLQLLTKMSQSILQVRKTACVNHPNLPMPRVCAKFGRAVQSLLRLRPSSLPVPFRFPGLHFPAFVCLALFPAKFSASSS